MVYSLIRGPKRSNVSPNTLSILESFYQNTSTIHYCCQNDKDWTMTEISKNCEEVVEAPLSALLTNEVTFGKMCFEAESGLIWKMVQNALENHRPFQVIYHITTPQRHEKLLFEQGEGIYKANGELVQLCGYISDITPFQTFFMSDTQSLMGHCATEVLQQAVSLGLIRVMSDTITQREIEVAIHYCNGLSMKEIALKLSISNRTIESHLKNIKSKLGCHTRAQLRYLFTNTITGKKLLLCNL